jgi:hypothetical protein
MRKVVWYRVEERTGKELIGFGHRELKSRH